MSKRIIALSEKVALDANDFLAVDNASDGSKKYKAQRILDLINSIAEAADEEIGQVADEVTDLKSGFTQISEEIGNLYSADLVQLGKNWTGGSAADRAVAYVPVKPSTNYYIYAPTNAHINGIQVIEKAANTGASGNLHLTNVNSGADAVITTTANTNYFCLQFVGNTTLSASDFTEYAVYVCEGDTEILTALDRVSRTILEENMSVCGNEINFSDVQIGKNWTGGTDTTKAVLYLHVTPNTSYYVSAPDDERINGAIAIEKAAATGASGNLHSTVIAKGTNAVITTTADTNYICFQFDVSTGEISEADFTNYGFYVVQGTEPQKTMVDLVARSEKEIPYFTTFKELAENSTTGLARVGGYEIRNLVKNPKALTHTQEAQPNPYYDVNKTIREYQTINPKKVPYGNIMRNLQNEEIDFTPSNNGFTRIVVGKDDSDLFFVAYVASNRVGAFGDPKYDALETTTDFVTFNTVLRSAELATGDGIVVPNMTNIKVAQVKQFADGSYFVAMKAHNISENNDYTHFYKLSADKSTITHMEYTNFDGETVDMIDEFNSDVYDWSVFVAGQKVLATTYGTRNPETDYGRVWYTENNGNTWKQVFQTNNHLNEGQPEGVTVTQAHTHGVMIDPYTGRLYVIVGEDNRNVFWTDKGINATDNDWNVIELAKQDPYGFGGMQVVNGYPFPDSLVFGSDNGGVGCIYRINKLDGGGYSLAEPAHEFLPNKFGGSVFYCAADLSRRDMNSPLLMCETRESARLTEENNELLNLYNKARVVATYDGVSFEEVWTDDTYGSHNAYINNQIVTRNYSYCTRGMNCWLLKNGDAVIKYAGRDYYYFGGDPMYSVVGLSNGSCKVRWIKNVAPYI